MSMFRTNFVYIHCPVIVRCEKRTTVRGTERTNQCTYELLLLLILVPSSLYQLRVFSSSSTREIEREKKKERVKEKKRERARERS